MADESLKRQVERVIEEGAGRYRQVIVRLREVDKDRDQVLRTASYRIMERKLTLSAREVWQRAAEGPRRKRSPEARRMRVPTRLRTIARRRLRAVGERCAQAIQKSDILGKYAEHATKGLLAAFPSARSALVEVSKDDVAKLFRQIPGVGDVYPNRELKLPRFVEVRQLPASVQDNKTSAWGVHAIGALAAWGAFGSRGAGTRIAVLDTGVDGAHPDLSGKVSDWAEFDFNGQQVPGSTPHDTDRHGTHVSGTIAGGNASGQFIGIAPDAQIAGAIVLTGGSGSDAQVLAGIDWAFELGVDAINMSLGGLTLGPDVPSTYTEAILTCLRAGIPVVTAIGNEGSQTSGSPGNDLFAFAVGATDPLDQAAGFSGGRTQVIQESNFLPPDLLPLPYSKPEISAPGVAVRSSVPGGGWVAFNGTSMATPHVAGAIALLLGATNIRGNLSGADRAFQIQDLLIGAVEELGESGQDHRFGFGRLDVLRAIGFAREAGL